ncbi:MAG: flagellar hook protein FlgE [Magnetococcales bacterium]|nr:flagellar hook protein FlgE [Magnetococcales bacterium]
MSILQAMYAGSSALTNLSEAMTVIGNNLANANTTAFKGSRTTFEDVLIQTVGRSGANSANQVGTGVALAAVDQDMTQGSFSSTTSATDLAIDGQGFFMVRDDASSSTGSDGYYYTRAGDFMLDLNGNLVTNSGMILQGWALDESGLATGGTTDIDLSAYQTAEPRQTNLVELELNLDSTAEIISDTTYPYDPNDPESYNFQTSVPVYDAQGERHTLLVHFRKIDDNEWEWHLVAPTEELEGATGTGDYTEIAQPTTADATSATYTPGTLTFDTSGYLLTEGSVPLSITFDGSEAQDILFDFGDALDSYGDSTNDYMKADVTDMSFTLTSTTGSVDDNTGRLGTVQYATDSTTLSLDPDGYPTGFLDSISVNSDGSIVGVYTNGESKSLYQISLVDFDNEMNLDQVGSNLFGETNTSGVPRVSEPESGRLGSIISYALEQSNVDMAGEFVQMIATQRGFQANSRIVTVSDGMLEELLALKR